MSLMWQIVLAVVAAGVIYEIVLRLRGKGRGLR